MGFAKGIFLIFPFFNSCFNFDFVGKIKGKSATYLVKAQGGVLFTDTPWRIAFPILANDTIQGAHGY